MSLSPAKQNLIRLRDFLAALPPERFTLAWWFSDEDPPAGLTAEEIVHDCGTCACIGGWAEMLFLPDSRSHQEVEVGQVLGLSKEQTYQLFYPGTDQEESGYPVEVSYGDVTVQDAITTLNILIKTGRIDWSHVRASVA